MFFIGVYEENGKRRAALYDNFEDWHRDTFSPEITEMEVLTLSLSLKGLTLYTVHTGKTFTDYEKKRVLLKQKALEWDRIAANSSGWTWGEIAIITAWFEKMAARFGLTREFRENGII